MRAGESETWRVRRYGCFGACVRKDGQFKPRFTLNRPSVRLQEAKHPFLRTVRLCGRSERSSIGKTVRYLSSAVGARNDSCRDFKHASRSWGIMHVCRESRASRAKSSAPHVHARTSDESHRPLHPSRSQRVMHHAQGLNLTLEYHVGHCAGYHTAHRKPPRKRAARED